MSRKYLVAMLAVCVFALTAVVSQADTILVLDNYSFEAPDTSSQTNLVTTSGTAANGWTCYWTASDLQINPQVIDPYPSWGYATPTDGDQFATVYTKSTATAGCLFSQAITTDGSSEFVIGGGNVDGTLTIGIDGAMRDNLGAGIDISLEVWNGDPDPAGSATKLGSQTFTIPYDNTYRSYTYDYTVQAADVGKTLWYALRTYPVSGQADGNNLQLDNATATFAPVPEPGTLALLVTGLLGLLAYAWKKRK